MHGSVLRAARNLRFTFTMQGVENRRHLLRLWVNHPDARPINPSRESEYVMHATTPGLAVQICWALSFWPAFAARPADMAHISGCMQCTHRCWLISHPAAPAAVFTGNTSISKGIFHSAIIVLAAAMVH